MHASTQHKSMKNPRTKNRTKMGHPIVLIGAVIMTLASIAGSVALADFVPLDEMKDLNQMVKSALSDDNREASKQPSEQISNENETNHSRDFKNIDFKSLISPKLSNCFNCAEIIAIESIPVTAYTLDNTLENTTMSQFRDYLDAHRDMTRMVSPAERKRVLATNEMLKEYKNTYLIRVRMQNGSEHTLTQDSPPQQVIGDIIKLRIDKTITA